MLVFIVKHPIFYSERTLCIALYREFSIRNRKAEKENRKALMCDKQERANNCVFFHDLHLS